MSPLADVFFTLKISDQKHQVKLQRLFYVIPSVEVLSFIPPDSS